MINTDTTRQQNIFKTAFNKSALYLWMRSGVCVMFVAPLETLCEATQEKKEFAGNETPLEEIGFW